MSEAPDWIRDEKVQKKKKIQIKHEIPLDCNVEYYSYLTEQESPWAKWAAASARALDIQRSAKNARPFPNPLCTSASLPQRSPHEKHQQISEKYANIRGMKQGLSYFSSSSCCWYSSNSSCVIPLAAASDLSPSDFSSVRPPVRFFSWPPTTCFTMKAIVK